MKNLLRVFFFLTGSVTFSFASELDLHHPQKDTTNISTRPAYFMWYDIPEPSDVAVTYDLYFGLSSTPELYQSGLYNGWSNDDYSSGALTQEYGEDRLFLVYYDLLLERQTSYYWKVVAKLSDGSEISSQVWSFTTNDENELPSAPVITYPLNNAMGIEYENLTIKWNESVDANNDPIKYNLYFGTSSDSMPLIAGPLSVLEYTLTDKLADQQEYYFKVTAIDEYDGTEVGSDNAPYKFTSENYENDTPDSFHLTYPIHNAVNTTKNLILYWEEPYDKDGDLLYYDVYLDENTSPSTLIASDITINALRIKLKDPYTRYYWKVRAKDQNGGESESSVYSFKPWKNKPKEFIEMVNVEGGSFSMGQPNPNIGYTGGSSDEQPVHSVNLNSYRIGKYEVTWAQFCDFLNTIKASVNVIDNNLDNDEEKKVVKFDNSIGSEFICFISASVDTDFEFPKIYWDGTSFLVKKGYENYPAENMSIKGSSLFCEWADGRLPTEAEWEYAARGGNQSNSYTYSGSNTINDVGWYCDNGENPYNPMTPYQAPVSTKGNGTHEAGTKTPNQLGIYDMSGNVSELVSDWYQQDYYNVSPTDNPQGPATMPEDDPAYIYRGGAIQSYDYDNRNCARIILQNFEGGYGMKFFRGFRFTTDNIINSAPDNVTLLTPVNSTSGITMATELSWQTTTDPEGDMVAYDVYLGTQSNPTTKIARNITSTSINISNLENNTTYYWKVIAKDNKGNTGAESNIWSFTTSTINKFTLSGTLLSEFGTPIENVELLGLDTEVKSDANGLYSVEVTEGWSGSIRPFKLDYIFSPETLEISDLSQNITNISITGRYTYYYTLIIEVQDANGQFITNVEMNVGDMAAGLSHSRYFANLQAGWSGIVKPVLEGYTFSPATIELNVLESDSVLSFAASYVGTYTVSGVINDASGNDLSGVPLLGFSKNVESNTNGHYSTSETAGWSGTITPSLNGYSFSPENIVISSLNADITQNFTANQLTSKVYVVTFNVTDSTNALKNANLSFNGSTYTTDASGAVVINNIKAGTYSYTITAAGFENTTGTITVSNADMTENINIDAITGLEDNFTFNIKCYPNPVGDKLFLNIPENETITSIEIFNIVGERLYSSNSKEKGPLEIDLSTCQKGLLFIRAYNTDDNVFIGKLVKE